MSARDRTAPPGWRSGSPARRRSWFDTGTDATAPPATPSAIPHIVTISSSIANCAATLTFFTPMAVSTPTSFLHSRMSNRLSTTAPTASTTISSVRANLARLSSGTRLNSWSSTSADCTVQVVQSGLPDVGSEGLVVVGAAEHVGVAQLGRGVVVVVVRGGRRPGRRYQRRDGCVYRVVGVLRGAAHRAHLRQPLLDVLVLGRCQPMVNGAG